MKSQGTNIPIEESATAKIPGGSRLVPWQTGEWKRDGDRHYDQGLALIPNAMGTTESLTTEGTL